MRFAISTTPNCRSRRVALEIHTNKACRMPIGIRNPRDKFDQANLDVGDPLTGTDLAPVKMPNGFSYHLQELAFFSWFYGAPSTAVHDWFSNNNTFSDKAGTPLDAGPPCP